MEKHKDFSKKELQWPAFRLVVALLALSMTGLLLTACEDDDDDENGTDADTDTDSDSDTDTDSQEMPQMFEVTIENVATAFDFFESGAFDTPVGEAGPGPLLPGQTYSFSLHAAPGHKLSFATMMVQSNDLFYAPTGDGIELFDGSGVANSGDVTGMIELWDGGTEINQEPGTGADQAPRQAAANTGAVDPDDTVRLATDDFSNLPAIADVISVNLAHDGDDTFTVSITNVSDSTTLTHSGGSDAVPLAPGVWVVHGEADPLFTAGVPDFGMGLEALAEDGDPSTLAGSLAASSGLTHIFSPGIWALHTEEGVFFENGVADAGLGLEALAEDGDPSGLAASLSDLDVGVFSIPVGATEPGVILPGSSYSFEFEAMPGDMLSLATMLVQSNDLFLSSDEMGIELFDQNDDPISEDFSDLLDIWDAGTEVNQRPGTGPDQAPRQSGPNTGADENGVVQPVDDGFTYPSPTDVLQVIITPI